MEERHPCHTKLCACRCLILENQIRGKLLLSRKLHYFRGVVSHNVLFYQQLPITRYQVRFYAYNYFEFITNSVHCFYSLQCDCLRLTSGVIFALKVLTTHYTPAGTQYVMGMFPVPSRYACWAELVLIQLLIPRASFTGHLAGILVGLAFVKGPLKDVLDILPAMLSSRPGEGFLAYLTESVLCLP